MKRIKRKDDWNARLVAYIGQPRAFAEGEHDCALFAAGAVRAMTGRDLAKNWRGTYASTKDGLRALKAAGFDDHVGLCASWLPEVPPAMAQPGDVAAVPGDGMSALGIVQGEWIYAYGPAGLSLVPLTSALRAFTV